jgi:hypothetical protein
MKEGSVCCRTVVWVAVVIVLAGAAVAARGQERNLTVLVKGNLTTRSSLFPNLNSADPTERAESVDFTDFLGSGVEIKYFFPRGSLAVGISADYLRFRTSNPITVSFRTRVPSEDGYVAIPVEATGYFIIPASGQTVKVFIGGGMGVYFGRREYSVAGVDAPVVTARPGFGIHVLAGVAYRFTDWFELTGEMKFRDLQFHSTNAFPVSRVPYQGSLISVRQTPFESSVQTDGIVFQLGVGVSL